MMSKQETALALTPQTFRDRLRVRKMEEDERISDSFLPAKPRDRSGVMAGLDEALSSAQGDVNIDEMNINPVREAPGFGDVALSLFDLTQNMISKTRLERRKRMLYTRAIVVARHFNLMSILQYVWMDLILMVPEDGKRIKEFLIPFENLLRERMKQNQNQARPEI